MLILTSSESFQVSFLEEVLYLLRSVQIVMCCDVSEAGSEAPGSSHQLYPVPLLCSLHK